MSMSSPSIQFASSSKMSIYETLQQVSSWEDASKGDDDSSPKASLSSSTQLDIGLDNKVQRRLAQNREAARKSRLRKKAYVQQLEIGQLKLVQLEQELEKAKQKGVYTISSSQLRSGAANSGIAAFEMEYTHWVEEQQKQASELRNALQAHVTDVELCMLVENGLNHYNNLFRIKADAAKVDVFYLMSGMWRTSTERFFSWIGGVRPSELLNVLKAQLEPMTEQQVIDVSQLQESSKQAEEALSQRMDELLHGLAQAIAAEPLGTGGEGTQMAAASEKLDSLEGFVKQADRLRQGALQQLCRVLTTHQAARGLVTLGEYFHRLRALNSLWAARPREAA